MPGAKVGVLWPPTGVGRLQADHLLAEGDRPDRLTTFDWRPHQVREAGDGWA